MFGNATQEWVDQEHNIKILFTPSPEYPKVGNLTQLSFSIQNLKTGTQIKNETATVTVLNNSAANTGTSASDNGVSNGETSFKNIVVPSGSFSVKYLFTDPGTHHIIARINQGEYICCFGLV